MMERLSCYESDSSSSNECSVHPTYSDSTQPESSLTWFQQAYRHEDMAVSLDSQEFNPRLCNHTDQHHQKHPCGIEPVGRENVVYPLPNQELVHSVNYAIRDVDQNKNTYTDQHQMYRNIPANASSSFSMVQHQVHSEPSDHQSLKNFTMRGFPANTIPNMTAYMPAYVPGTPMGVMGYNPMIPIPGSTGRGGMVKYCGVCGDLAKSYHFGGLSCDSCKAFFRRSVQNDNYLHFQCCHGGQCVISMTNRKSCQYCRMKRCFSIGMEKSWVMTEEERKALMKTRAEKKLNKQMASAAAMASSTTVGGKGLLQRSPSSSSLTKEDPDQSDYEPQVECMIDYLSPLEIKEVESIVTKYVHAYQHVPYRAELRHFDNDRPGFQVMEMFGTLIRRFAFYARMMADFSSLPPQDQRTLLKGGVLEMCFLRGALVFDPVNNRWPNTNMSLYKDTPVLKLGNVSHLTSSRIFQMHTEFISFIQQLGVDEPTIMLLVLIVLFTERSGLLRPNWVEKYQAYYLSLLERYMGWRFGPPRAKHMFNKLLTKLTDLRELSDIHNQRNMHMGEDEIASIQQQLQHLKLNPYPEAKVVPEDNNDVENLQRQTFVPASTGSQLHYQQATHANSTSSPLSLPNTVPDIPVRQSSISHATTENRSFDAISSSYSKVPHEQLSKLYSKSSIPLATVTPTPAQTSFANHHQSYQYNLTCQGSLANLKPNNMPTIQHVQPPQKQQLEYTKPLDTYTMPVPSQRPCTEAHDGSQHSVSSSAEYSFNNGNAAGAGQFAMFMRAMQHTVSQVVDQPHFGFEWVQPDYKFDGFNDAESLVETLSSSPEFSNNQFTSSPSTDGVATPDITSNCANNKEGESGCSHEVVQPPTTESSTLSPKTMMELFEELEEFTELYNQ